MALKRAANREKCEGVRVRERARMPSATPLASVKRTEVLLGKALLLARSAGVRAVGAVVMLRTFGAPRNVA